MFFLFSTLNELKNVAVKQYVYKGFSSAKDGKEDTGINSP
jgi:hypothetical protein